ncbi:MAG: hypothetical protein PHH08_03335 [Candidatus ainarchaeum sp.]|nr:hypothetical protein [Candidatus ainarchaeum sp.]
MAGRVTRRGFLKKTGLGLGLVLGAKGCREPETRSALRPTPRIPEEMIARQMAEARMVPWKKKLREMPKPKTDPVRGIITKKILMAELIFGTRARLIAEQRLPSNAGTVLPEETVNGLPISSAMIGMLKAKGFLKKEKKYDFSNNAKPSLADYYKVRTAWYRYAASEVQKINSFKAAPPSEKTRMLVAAGRSRESLLEFWNSQKIIPYSEADKYVKSIMECAKLAE